MTYKKLSDMVSELGNPQRSDAFVKLFRSAVREGKIEAMDLQERFKMPKMYSRRGAEGQYQRDTKDMLFEVTPAVTKWFDSTKDTLAKSGRTRKVKPTVEAIQSGAFDFKAAADETRRKMQAKFEKGQKLGQTRAKKSKS